MDYPMKFKVASYLIRNVSQARSLIGDLDCLRRGCLPGVLPKCLEDVKGEVRAIPGRKWESVDLARPENLVSVLWSCLGPTEAYSLVRKWLESRYPELLADGSHDPFDTDEWHGLLSRYEASHPSDRALVTDALSRLSKEELQRVKVFLSWNMTADFRRLPFRQIEDMNHLDLSRAVVSKHANHAGYVLRVILTQIGRVDLAEEMAGRR